MRHAKALELVFGNTPGGMFLGLLLYQLLQLLLPLCLPLLELFDLPPAPLQLLSKITARKKKKNDRTNCCNCYPGEATSVFRVCLRHPSPKRLVVRTARPNNHEGGRGCACYPYVAFVLGTIDHASESQLTRSTGMQYLFLTPNACRGTGEGGGEWMGQRSDKIVGPKKKK